ncbi:ExbD/TolR family protein [Marinobacter salicampi]|uniref:ExbD/TolR family protein n=1 Tax=Marinobacter salicampi TaxID=435907 RepID=UPI001F5EFE47|nr:biopolymer transporter ExbD [Marinobacter salicampi]
MNKFTPITPGSGKSLLDRVEDSLLPLINLVFLLLMFFIVAGKISEVPLPELPAMAGEDRAEPPKAELVVESADRWLVAGEPVARADLADHLPQPGQDQPLRIAASRDITMADLEALFRLLEELGHTDILLLTEPTP